MIRKDILLAEVEKIGLVLAKILGLKKEGKVQEAHELATQTVVSELILPSDLDALSTDEFETELINNKFTREKLDVLAQVLFESAHPFEDLPHIITRLHKTLVIYRILEEEYHIQSLGNLAKREMIDKFLNKQQYG